MREGHRLRRLAPPAVTLAAVVALAAVPAAEADHLSASVSATASLGKAVRYCQDEGDPCARGRRVHVAWQASCGPAAPPDALETVDVSIVGLRPDGTRFTIETLTANRQLSGSDSTLVVPPGLRFVAEVLVTCRTFTGTQEHLSTATGSSAELYLAPQVKGVRAVFGITSSCRVIPFRKLDQWLQKGRRTLLTWQMSYVEESLLAPGVREAAQIRLFARGVGVRLNLAPNRRMLRRYRVIGLPVRPRRAGTLRVWATINGQRTNTFGVKVLPC